MSACHGLPYYWVLWCPLAFWVLTLLPRPPRTVLAPASRFIHAMIPVWVGTVTLLFSGLLGFILSHRPLDSGTLILIMVTAAGIGLLLHSFDFPNPRDSGFLLRSFSCFMAGLAWASCSPAAWFAANSGNPALLLAGAACGLLPDTLDQWVARFLHRTDIHIVPDPLAPDPAMIANALATAAVDCHDSGHGINVQWYASQVGADEWQTYTVRFDNNRRRITVTQGEVSSSASLPITIATDRTVMLAIHDNPVSLGLEPDKQGRVTVRVMPWEQGWSHSLMAAAIGGLLTGCLLGWPAGLVACGAWLLHIAADQINFTGSKLLFPFTRTRYTGLQWIHPGQSVFFHVTIIWISILLLGWNWCRMISPDLPIPSPLQLVLFAGAIPLALFARMFRRCPR